MHQGLSTSILNYLFTEEECNLLCLSFHLLLNCFKSSMLIYDYDTCWAVNNLSQGPYPVFIALLDQRLYKIDERIFTRTITEYIYLVHTSHITLPFSKHFPYQIYRLSCVSDVNELRLPKEYNLKRLWNDSCSFPGRKSIEL